MSKPYDATSKDLLELGPADWVTFLGAPRSSDQVQLVDADLSSVTAEADKVIRVADAQPWLLHLEFQTRSERFLPRRLLRYNAMLQERHECPVASAVILLRREAEASDLSGEWPVSTPVLPDWTFGYRVLRVWQLDVESLLQGGLSLLPLAPIANVTSAELPQVVDQLAERLRSAPSLALQGRLWTAIHILLGLRYETEFIEQLLQGVMGMEDSTTYQAILRKGLERGERLGLERGERLGLERGEQKGRADEARQAVLRVGRRRLHAEPTQQVVDQLGRITDVAQLEELLDRVLEITDWSELFSDH